MFSFVVLSVMFSALYSAVMLRVGRIAGRIRVRLNCLGSTVMFNLRKMSVRLYWGPVAFAKSGLLALTRVPESLTGLVKRGVPGTCCNRR